MIKQLLQPLQPYLALIKLGAVAALLAVVWIKGCDYGEGRKAEEVARLTATVSGLRAETAGYREAEALREEEVRRAVEEAKQRGKLADEAAKETANLRKKLAKKENELALAEAYNKPSCAALLKEEVCPAVPLP